MSALHRWQFLLIIVAGGIKRHQHDVIDYLLEENRALKGQLRGRRLRLTDDERRRLAVKAKALGRSVFDKVLTIVTPDTIMAWYRKLVARKWGPTRHGGSPAAHGSRRTSQISSSAWRTKILDGATRGSRGLSPIWAMTSVVAPSPTSSKKTGSEPTFERSKRTPWRTFLKAHWDTLAAADFFTVEVSRMWGLVTYYTLFFMERSTRRVHITGITPNPDGRFVLQVARNLTDAFDGFLLRKGDLILDRDGKYTQELRAFLTDAGTNIVRLPARSPDLNTFFERYVLSIKSDCLDGMIFFTESSIRRVISSYLAHYHGERLHQGLGNRLIEGDDSVGERNGATRCCEWFGGTLRYYYRQAA